jgi:hypothetical protein
MGERSPLAGSVKECSRVACQMAGDLAGCDLELARARGRRAGREAHVKRGFPATSGDLQHVVLLQRDRPAADLPSACSELAQVRADLRTRREHDRP